MPRVEPIELEVCDAAARDALLGVRARLGMIPNLLLVMARSPTVLEGFLGLEGALERSVLPAKLREQIALAVAERNRSTYSVARHAAFGRAVGLSEEEIADARQGHSASGRRQAVLRFACALVDKRGHLTDGDWTRLRTAGLGDREILDIVAAVCTALVSDYFAEAIRVESDFPEIGPEIGRPVTDVDWGHGARGGEEA